MFLKDFKTSPDFSFLYSPSVFKPPSLVIPFPVPWWIWDPNETQPSPLYGSLKFVSFLSFFIVIFTKSDYHPFILIIKNSLMFTFSTPFFSFPFHSYHCQVKVWDNRLVQGPKRVVYGSWKFEIFPRFFDEKF